MPQATTSVYAWSQYRRLVPEELRAARERMIREYSITTELDRTQTEPMVRAVNR
jgi:hypothetical protein